MISFSCPRCQAYLSADDDRGGVRSACPPCGQSMVIPAPPVRPPAVGDVPELEPAEEPPLVPVLSPEPVVSRTAAPSTPEVREVNGRRQICWACPTCGTALHAPVTEAGFSTTCPRCRRPVPIPDPRAP